MKTSVDTVIPASEWADVFPDSPGFVTVEYDSSYTRPDLEVPTERVPFWRMDYEGVDAVAERVTGHRGAVPVAAFNSSV